MLKSVKLETNHHTRCSVAYYAYFDGPYDANELRSALRDATDARVERGPLAPLVEDVQDQGEEVRAKGGKLRRFFACQAG